MATPDRNGALSQQQADFCSIPQSHVLDSQQNILETVRIAERLFVISNCIFKAACKGAPYTELSHLSETLPLTLQQLTDQAATATYSSSIRD